MFLKWIASLLLVLTAIPAYGQLVRELTPNTWFKHGRDTYNAIQVVGDQLIVVGQNQIDSWDLTTGAYLWQITTQDNPNASQIWPGSIWATADTLKFLESDGYTATIRTFDGSRNEQRAKPLDIADVGISRVKWSADGKRLAIVGSRNYQTELLILENDKLSACEKPAADVSQLIFSPSGEHLVYTIDQRLNHINVIDVASGKLLRSSGAFVENSRSIAITADGRTIVVAGSANDSNGVLFLDFQTLRPTELAHVTSQQLLQDHHAEFTHATLFNNDQLCAFSLDGAGIVILDVESRTKVAELKGNDGATALAVSADNQWLVSIHHGTKVSVWRWRDVLKELQPIKTITSHLVGDRNPQLTFSPTENLLAITCAREAKSDNYADSSSVAGASRDDLAFSSSGERQPVVVILVDPTTGELRGTLGTNQFGKLNLPATLTDSVENAAELVELAISHDGKRLAAASDNGYLFIWDLVTKQLERIESSPYPHDLVFDPNGQSLWVAGYYGLSEYRPKENWQPRQNKDIRGASIAISRDGKSVLLGLAAYSKADLAKVFQAPDSYIDDFLGVTCEPNGQFAFGFLQDKLARWNLETGTTDMPFVLHRDYTGIKILDCALSPNGKILATSAEDSRIRLWDTTNSQLVITLVGHVGPVNSIEFSPDGNRLASIGVDGTTRLWDVAPFTAFENNELANVTPRGLPTNVSYKLNNGSLVKVIFDRPAEHAEIEAALIEALNQLRKDGNQ